MNRRKFVETTLSFTLGLALVLLGPPRPQRAVLHGPADPGEALERWMRSQRAFPEKNVPPDGRRAAFAAVQEYRAAHPEETAGYRWRSLGPAPIVSPSWSVTGRVTAVVISPLDSKLVIVGTSSGGIWRSTDGGASFAPVTDDQPNANIVSIAFAPSNPRVLYAGMGEDHLGTGVLKSTDAGATWQLATTSSFTPSRARKVLVDPRDENTIWLVMGDQLNAAGNALVADSHLLESADGGATWTTAFGGFVYDALIASDDGATLFVGAARYDKVATGGIYRTTDRGKTWKQVLAPGDQSVPPAYYLAAAGGTLYAVAIDSADGDNTDYRLLTSADGGDHWTQLSTFTPQSRFFYLAASKQVPPTLYLGGISSLRSTDGGRTWGEIYTHADQHGIGFDPGDPSRVWLGNDGGLFRSGDGGVTFQSLASLLPIAQFNSVLAHPTDPATLFAGAQDNGLDGRSGSGLSWTELAGGDSGNLVFDSATNPKRILGGNYLTFVSRYPLDGNGAVDGVGNAFANDFPRVSFVPPLVASPDGTVWFGTWRLFSSKDFGTTWTPGNQDLTTGDHDALSAIGVAAGDSSVLYTGSQQGRVMITHDGAQTWSDITPPVHRYVSAIAVNATSPSTAWVGFSGYHSAHVYHTATAGTTWTDASAGLPDIPVDTIYVDPRNPDNVYAGTDIGVFRFDAAAATWKPFGNGMPPVIVTSFTTTADGRLIAGTYGRGAYVLTPVVNGPEIPHRHVGRH
jgi:photosystem II stability/assembly factor-like uncharacterized protein